LKALAITPLSLTPSFSWVNAALAAAEPLQRFLSVQKLLKRFNTLNLAEHPAEAGC